MKFSDVFSKKAIVADLQSTNKEAVIREMIAQMVDSGVLRKDQSAVVEKAVLRREELGSTGIGKGVAVPHAKVSGISGVIGGLGRSNGGVAFNALDGQPVHLVFMLLSSPEEVESHLRMLRKVTTLLKDDDLCTFFKRAKSREDMAGLLAEAEGRVPG